MSGDEFVNGLDITPPPAARGKNKKLKRAGSRAGTTRDQANKATGGRARMHGKKKQLNTRIPLEMFPGVIDAIRHHAERLGVTQDSLQLWCLLTGLDALDEGVEPAMERAQTRNTIVF